MSKKWAVIFTIAMGLAVAPAMADQDEGFFIELEGAFSDSGNTNAIVAATGPSDGQICCSGTTPIFNSLNGTNVEGGTDPKITLGYSWGEKGSLSVSFWSFSEDDSVSGTTGGYPEYTWFGIGPAASWGYSFYEVIDFSFTQEVEADSIDIVWSSAIQASERVNIDLGVGARIASYENNVMGSYILDPTGLTPYLMPAMRMIEGDGFGLTGNIGVSHELTDVVSLSSNMRVGFIQTDVDTSQQITDVDGYYSTAGTVWRETNSSEDETSLQVEFDAGVDFQLTDMIDLGIGYTYRSWDGIGDGTYSRSVFGTDDQAGLRITGEDNGPVTFSGPRVRVRFRF